MLMAWVSFNINLRLTAAESLWSNGIVERHNKQSFSGKKNRKLKTIKRNTPKMPLLLAQ